MKVITHNGIFHCDEVMACAILFMLAFSKEEKVELIRTRDRKIVAEALTDINVIVFDVGGEFNNELNNFDHHQKDFTLTRGNGVKYSSAGLIWRSYGKELPLITQEIWQELDDTFFSAIDAIDNGIEGWDSPISSIISGLNPVWWDDHSSKAEDDTFKAAVFIATEVLKSKINSTAGALAAKQYVYEGLFLHEGRVIILEYFVPWQRYVCNDEKFSSVQFICFPDKGGEWRIQTVPTSEDSFVSRKPLPEAWAGLRNEEFSEITGIDDGVFCHSGRFIAGAKSRESIIKLAEMAVIL